MEKYLDKNSVLRLLQGIKTQIDRSKTSVLDTKGVANGIASLDENGNVPLSQLGNVDTDIHEIALELPTQLTEKQSKHIFLVPRGVDEKTNKNIYKEYIFTGSDITNVKDTDWEQLGEFTTSVDLKDYSKKSETISDIRFTDTDVDGSFNPNVKLNNLLFEFADGKRKLIVIPLASGPLDGDAHKLPGCPGFMSGEDKGKLDKIDLNALTASINAANTAANNTNTAIQAAETATLGAERVNAELDGNVLKVTNRNGEVKSVNLTDTDEHVTVNCTTTMEGVSMEGLVINVYINNGADPHQYTTDANGQAEFTINKGATYKVVFPYVQKCNIIDPVQHIASVGNRIIDANYIAETEKMERLTIKMSKADESGNITPWEGGKAYVTIAGKKTEYIMDADGRAVVDIKNGTSYTVTIDKIDGMYEQYDRYSITRTAIAESYRFNFIYRPYESGIWLIDDNNKQWTYDDWEASGNDNSKLMFVRIATLATQRYNGDILISIDKMADFSKVAVSKKWCDQNVEFKNIPINGRDTNNSNWSRFAYNGLLATQTIIAEGDERGLTTDAADYCYSSTIANGDKLYQGYLPTVYQWELTWQNMDIVIDAISKKYPDLNVNKTTFSGNKWTSTQGNASFSYCFVTAVSNSSKVGSCLAIPFYACLSDSPSLLSLPDEQDGSLAQAA